MIGLENPIHIALILIVVLLVFGAKRLPEMGKSMGEGLRGFKQSLSGEDQVASLATRSQPDDRQQHASKLDEDHASAEQRAATPQGVV